MFCTNCGTEMKEQWKVCPNCGKENVMKTEEIVSEGAKLEAQDVSYEKEQNKEDKIIQQFQFEGFRRTNRFSFKYYASEVEITGDKIKTIVHKKKDVETAFSKSDISDIKFPYLPVLRGVDIFAILLFVVLAFFTKGLMLFAALLFAKISMVKHMQIQLKDGRKVEIPIRQAAETVEFLEAIDYPRNIIEKIASSAVSNATIMIREWIVSGIMIVIAVLATSQLNASIDEQSKPQIDVSEQEEETEFVGMTGTYQCGSNEESGVISIYIIDDQNVSITIGTHQNPIMLEENGTIIDRNTVVMKWDGGTTCTLQWSDEGIFTIQRDGSSGNNDVDIRTDNVKYVNAEHYQVS